MWRWVFQELADSTTVGEMDTLTTPGFRTRSNGLKFFTGMLGRPPTEQDDTDTLIGQDFDVTWGPNQGGTGHRRRGIEAGPYGAAGSGNIHGERRGATVLDPFTRSVLSERARLALSTPRDEQGALAPLTEDEAWALIARVTAEDAERT